MATENIVKIDAFNLAKLVGHVAVQLKHPNGGDNHRRTQNCLVLRVSELSITLVSVTGFYEDSKLEEKEFPIDAFVGINCYELAVLSVNEPSKEEMIS